MHLNLSWRKYRNVSGCSKMKFSCIQERKDMNKLWESTSTKIWPNRLKNTATEIEKGHWQSTSNYFWPCTNHFSHPKTVKTYCGKKISSNFYKNTQANPNLIPSPFLKWFLILGYSPSTMAEYTNSSNQPSSTPSTNEEPHIHPNIFQRWIFSQSNTIWSKLKEPTCDSPTRKNVASATLPFPTR